MRWASSPATDQIGRAQQTLNYALSRSRAASFPLQERPASEAGARPEEHNFMYCRESTMILRVEPVALNRPRRSHNQNSRQICFESLCRTHTRSSTGPTPPLPAPGPRPVESRNTSRPCDPRHLAYKPSQPATALPGIWRRRPAGSLQARARPVSGPAPRSPGPPASRGARRRDQLWRRPPPSALHLRGVQE